MSTTNYANLTPLEQERVSQAFLEKALDVKNEEELHNAIRQLVNDYPVVLFMKGIKDFPACGFSARVVGILEEYGIQFVSIDVLKSSEIRNAIKTFTNWPTIPQLYVNGKFIGGCDIVTDMHQDNELALLFDKQVAKV